MAYIYKSATGMIDRVLLACPEGMETLQCGPDEAWLPGMPDDATQVVDISVWPHTLKAKSILPYQIDKIEIAADDMDCATISVNLAGALVSFERTLEPILGSFEFTADYPGDYVLRILHRMYLPASVVISAR